MSADRHAAVERALETIRAGGMVILVDDEDRENEGDLTMAADLVTPEAINFMAKEGRGLICLSVTEERVAQLGLPMMTADNQARHHTAFTVSVDARHGTTTGISARERAETIRVAVARNAGPDDLVIPGHVFPLRARRGGVLVRSGQTEGSVDLARLAGREPAGVICEIMREDGEMARMPELVEFSRRHGLPIVKIADLIQYRLEREMLVRPVSEAKLRPRLGGVTSEFRAVVYATDVEDTEYLALVLGEVTPDKPILVRVQTASVLRDVLGASPFEGDHPATVPLRMIEEAGAGILLYVFPRGRASMVADFKGFADAAAGATGEPAVKPARAPAERVGEGGLRPTEPVAGGLGNPPRVPALTDFGLGAQVLAHLGARTVRLLTNHPRRIVGLGGYGIEVAECVPIRPPQSVVALRGADGGQRTA
ncbi:MAG TPA: 3,4-dihydroxy-2-butanone-4-phosphate synthase [Polyangia bacterium]|nr:3,4-dihydroxy-2-butanone-4-phosphate synthase [Polyangia bacterium]